MNRQLVAVSRHEANRRWHGSAVIDELVRQGIPVRSPSLRGVAEAEPLAYKDFSTVAAAADLHQGVAWRRLLPLDAFQVVDQRNDPAADVSFRSLRMIGMVRDRHQ